MLSALRTRPSPLLKITSLRDSFDSLRVRNYRLYVISQVLTNTFGWAARVAQNWLILTLTGSPTMVGLTVALQFGPIVFLGLLGGVLADRYPRRTLLTITQTIFGLSTLSVGVLAITGRVEAWHVLVAASVVGVATAFDNPARQAFVHETAGPQHLRQAIGLNSAVFQLGALVGPAVAGLLIGAFGEGWAFLLNAAASFVAVGLLIVMRTSELTPTVALPRAKGQLREGLAYARRSPTILWPVILVGFVGLTGVNLTTVLAAYADEVFETGAGGYALLNSMLAVGALTGALISTRRRRVRLRQLLLLSATIAVLEVVAAFVTQQAVFVALLVVLGTVTLVYIIGNNVLLQVSVADELRGRVMAIYVLVSMGAQAASGLIIGWVAEQAGPHVAMGVCAVGPAVGVVIVGWRMTRGLGMGPREVVGRLQAGSRSLTASVSASVRSAVTSRDAEAVTSAADPASSYADSPDEMSEPRRTSATPATTRTAPTA